MLHLTSRCRRALSPLLLVALALGSGFPPAIAEGGTGQGWSTVRLARPARTVVRDASGGFIAELTDGARTVTFAGPRRSWTEPGLATAISTDRWVRLLPAAYDGTFDAADASWLSSALTDTAPDVLAVAFAYVAGAADVMANGLVVAGDAAYGSAAGADFNDFLGIPWTYGASVDRPEPEEYRALDCSGFVRMVLGYRVGMRMTIKVHSGSLPRSAADQLAGGPGRVVARDRGSQVTSFRALRAGDLVFFDASSADGTRIDHVGIYVGRDELGHHRFISSRRKADGPTIGDIGGPSILDGSGYWASSFRAVRRP